MWYLQTDTLILIAAFTVVIAAAGWLLRKFRPEWNLAPALIIFDLALLLYVSEKLTAFYIAYTCVSYALIWLLLRVKRGRRLLFVAFCVLDILPLFYARSAAFGISLPMWVTLIGFAYNMLKAVDGLFYVYYSGQRIPFLTYCNYLLFFPVITAGPIFRYRDFLAAYEHPKALDAGCVIDCVKRIILGLFKKLVLVTWLMSAISYLFAHSPHFYVTLLLIAASYLCLYSDLSGYSDIAIAVSRLVGIPAPENFKQPWTAASFTQFWRKWHVSLSDWIREHIFVVVNGKQLNKYISALIGIGTMLVMALWHGFSKKDIFCGLFLGAFLAIENIFGLSTVNRRKTKKWVYALRCAAVFFLFGVNAMFYFLSGRQVISVLGGLFRL